MKKTVAVIGTAVLLIAGRCIAAEEAAKEQPAAAKAEVKAQTKCPVMGGAIDKKQFADHDGKRVYFCCGGCSAKFNKEPAKYIKQLEDSGVTLDKTPAKDEKAAGPSTAEPAKGGCGGGGCCK